jgi:hypothetical protein
MIGGDCLEWSINKIMEFGILFMSALAIIASYVAMKPPTEPEKETRNLSEVCPLEFNAGEFDYKDPI